MNSPEYPDNLRNLWVAFSKLRARTTVDPGSSAIIELFAALIVLRHVLELDDASLPAKYSWNALSNLPPDGMKDFLMRNLPSGLAQNIDPHLSTLLRNQQVLLDPDPQLLWFAIDRISSYNFKLKTDRQKLLEELEAYISFSAEKSPHLGQFITPPKLVDLAVKIANPSAGQSFYDPFCGMGGFLARVSFELSRRTAMSSVSSTETHIWGQDIIPGLALITAARLILSGDFSSRICIGDSLAENHSPVSEAEKFDCIISSPPFGGRVARPVLGEFGVRSTAIDVLAIQRIIASLAQNGVAIIVVPESTLYGGGAQLRLRQFLLENVSVDAVVALPRGIQSPYTSIKTNLLVVSQRPPQGKVLFVSEQFTSRLFLEENEDSLRAQLLSLVLTGRIKNIDIESDAEEVLKRVFRRIQSAGIDRDFATSAVLDASDCFQLVRMIRPIDPKIVSQMEEAFHSSFTLLLPDQDSEISVWETSTSEIMERAYELVVRNSHEDSLTPFITKLAEYANATSQISRLVDIADVFTGVRYRSQFLSENPEPNAVPLLRVQDVTLAAKKVGGLPEPGKPRKYLLPFANKKPLQTKHMLRRGDILLTASGTIGVVGIVGDTTIDAVPAHGIIVVRPNEGTDPLYVLRLLQSIPYKQWLVSHATGSTINHLSVEKTRELPIVMLPTELASRLTRFLIGGEDATTILSLLTNRGQPQDDIEVVSEKRLRELTSAIDWRSTIDAEHWWERLKHWCREVPTEKAQAIDPYLGSMSTLAGELIDAKSAPPGSDRYALLQSCRNRLVHSRKPNTSQLTLWGSPIFRKYSELLTQVFVQALNAETAKLLEDIGIDAVALPSIINVNTPTEIEITVKNRGSLPLKNIEFETNPSHSSAKFPWFKPSEVLKWPCSVLAFGSGRLSIFVAWTAQRMDGSLADGRLEIAIEATPHNAESIEMLFAENPYVRGAPIDSTDMFYGRSDTIARIRRSLRRTGPSTVIVLEGNRRAGKTSLCKQLLLPDPDLLPSWIRGYWSLQDAPGDASRPGLHTSEIYFNMARALLLATYDRGISAEIIGLKETLDSRASRVQVHTQMDRLHGVYTNDNAFRLLDAQVEILCETIGSQRLLLILDEFEKLQEGIDSGITSPQVPENLRDLFQRYNKLSGILTGSKRIRKLREEYWSILYGIGIRINIGALDREAARNLIEKPSVGALVFTESATERIIELTACQPFLIQSLCHCIFEECANKEIRSVTVGTIETAVSQDLEENEHFAALWQYISSDLQRYIAYLVEISSGTADAVTSSFLMQKLQADGISTSSLDADLSDLRELDVLAMHEFSQGNTYYIAIPLFAMWMRKHRDFAICRSNAIAE